MSASITMMGLHQAYPVVWGAERMDGLTLDLGLEMFPPVPTELTVSGKESEPWTTFLDSPPKQEQIFSATEVPNRPTLPELVGDPSVLLQSSHSPGRKRKMSGPDLSYPPEHQQTLANVKIERDEVVDVKLEHVPSSTNGMCSVPRDFTFSDSEGFHNWRNVPICSPEVRQYSSGVDVSRQTVSEVTNGSFLSHNYNGPDIKPVTLFSTRFNPAVRHPQELVVHDGSDSDDDFMFEEQETPQARDASPVLKPLVDGNQAIREMPQDAADAFMELFRIVKACDVKVSLRDAIIDSRNSHVPATVCHSSEDDHPQPDFLQVAAEPDFSQVIADLDFSHSVAESDNPCSLHEPAGYSRLDKRGSNAQLVLYDPKPEPVESVDVWSEHTTRSVVHVKEEVQHYPFASAAGIVAESAGVPSLASRNLILTALSTFEQCRQQILRDPSYGQTIADSLKSNNTDDSKSNNTDGLISSTPDGLNSSTPDGLNSSNPDGLKRNNNNRRLRADLKAACLMRKKGFWLNEKVRPIGEVAGVSVGDRFRYRIEMAVIGLHRAVQAGIAVVPNHLSPYGVPVASSVVIGVSDPYQDDYDMGDTVVYSGQGGLCGKTKESQDQKLERGNLAMSNSYEKKVPVRLIRGHKEQNSMTGISYSYDGLYQIVDMTYVTGVNGKKVYKFTLLRLPGQRAICSSAAYPTPLGSQGPGLPVESGVSWTEPSETKTLYLDKHSVY